MRLLLDEMLSATIAEQLRARGHDVVAVQDPGMAHLRGAPDAEILEQAVAERRAVVTDNVPDFVRLHRAQVAADEHHFGLLFFASDSFPRHRHDVFVGHVVVALAGELAARPDDDRSSWIGWLTR